MAQTLDANLNVIQETPIELELINGDLSIISKLDDEPNDVGGLTSTELKAKFDEAGNTIKDYINNTLVPAVLAADATEATRNAAEAERVANEVERVAQEGVRTESESTRVAQENTRKADELLRVNAENARAAAEQTRASNEAERISNEEQRIVNENAREDLETGYVAQAEAAAKRAEEAAKNAQSAVGGDYATKAQAQSYANTAERNAKSYTDTKIAAIPTPDVSAQIAEHNADPEAHPHIRSAVSAAQTTANNAASAVASKAPMYTYGTTDLEAGVTPLASGMLHFVYEGDGGGSDVATFSFTIDNNGGITGGTYMAEVGMTWAEWVASGYNTVGASITGANVTKNNGGQYLYFSPNSGVDGAVVATNVIPTVADGRYYWTV